MLDNVDKPLSKEMLIEMNKILKRNTSDEDIILEDLKLDRLTLEDIISFHIKFERIHLFGDGNGHVARMIMFKK